MNYELDQVPERMMTDGWTDNAKFSANSLVWGLLRLAPII